MSNILEFTKNSALRAASPSSALLSALALSTALDATPAPAASFDIMDQTHNHLILGHGHSDLGFGLSPTDLLLTDTGGAFTIDNHILGFSGISQGYTQAYEYEFSVWEEETEMTRLIDAGLAEAKERREVAESFAQSVITQGGVDADGDTIYRVGAPDPEKMSIHTAFRGEQVREGSDTYVVEGEMGESVITFKALDVDGYTAVQERPDPRGHFNIGEQIDLGQAIEEGKVRASENARLFAVSDAQTGEIIEFNAGIGFPMLEAGDGVKGTIAHITDANGNLTEIDVTDYIMDAQRMSELNVKAGGDGTIPTDYLVIAITEGSQEVLEQFKTALEQPGATIQFHANSNQGRRVSTTPVAFGELWQEDVELGQEIIADGADYSRPLSQTFGVIASVNFGEGETLDQKLRGCEFLQIDPKQIENYDYYLGNLDGFSGPYPRDHDVIFATQEGTQNVIAVGAPNMWGVNIENPQNGIDWAMTGSFENVAISLTPEELRQLSHGCTQDNEGHTAPPYTPPGDGTTYRTTERLVTGGGSGITTGWFTTTTGGGGGTTTTTTTGDDNPNVVWLGEALTYALTAYAMLEVVNKGKNTKRAANGAMNLYRRRRDSVKSLDDGLQPATLNVA